MESLSTPRGALTVSLWTISREQHREEKHQQSIRAARRRHAFSLALVKHLEIGGQTLDRTEIQGRGPQKSRGGICLVLSCLQDLGQGLHCTRAR